ncbi:20216_t:CDS:2, partial [Funneliformis geosporum]
SPFEIAFNVPESVAVQLKKHTPFGENVELEVLPETAENPKDQEAPTISQNISSVKNIPILDDQQKITHLEEGCFGGTESEQNDELIPPLEKNLIVEQELIQQLSTTINNDEVSSIFRRDIGSVDLDPSLVSAQSIVHMFREAIQSGQNAVLCWYYFAEKYDKRIDEVSANKKVDVNLRQKLLRARKIRTLFSAVGVEKIRLISYSANAISNLSYTQTQNIIDHVTKM